MAVLAKARHDRIRGIKGPVDCKQGIGRPQGLTITKHDHPDHYEQMSEAELQTFERMCRRFEKYLQGNY